MYSLMGGAFVAADLVRLPAGVAVVDVLDQALRIDRAQLSELGAAFRDDVARRSAWRELESAVVRHELSTTGRVGSANEGAAAGPIEQALAATPVGSFDDLLDCLHEDVLGWTRSRRDEVVVQPDWAGAHAVADALAAAYAGAALSPDSAAVLRRPWSHVYGDVPAVAPAWAFGPRSTQVRRVVDRLARADTEDLLQVRDAHLARQAAARDWAWLMHHACQLSFVSGRVREVAAAQLALARATLVSQVALPLVASGLMSALIGVMQAVALADLLDEQTYAPLALPWLTVFGAP